MLKVFPGNKKQQPPLDSVEGLADDVQTLFKFTGVTKPDNKVIRASIIDVLKDHNLWGNGLQNEDRIRKVKLELSRRGGKASGRISHQRALERKARAKAADPQMWLPLGGTKPIQTFLI